MKKSWSPFVIISVALILGLLIGVKIFQQDGDEQKGELVKLQDSKVSVKEKPVELKDHPVKKQLKGKEFERGGPFSKLKALIDEELKNLDQQCEQEFLSHYPTDDFLDQESKVFSTSQSYEKGLMLLNSIFNSVSVSLNFDLSSDAIYMSDSYNPNTMRTLMPYGIVCNDVKYTNFMHALVRSLAQDKAISTEIKRKFVIDLLDLAAGYVIGFKRMEYTFSSMEYLYALGDNELIPREYLNELSQIRQDIIRFSQDFESEYRLENDSEVNRELLRTYRDANEETNEAIILLIDRVKADIPG